MSGPGNLHASTLIRLRKGDPPAQQLGFVAALALHRTLSAWVASPRLSLKWPNDLLMDGAKLSGILLEREGDAVIAGFGVNLAHHPGDVERPAISLAAAGVAAPSPDSLMQALAECWEKEVAGWRSQGFAAVREAWMTLAHAPGTLLAARLANGEDCQGRYGGLDADGALLLRMTDGSVRAIHAGDVFQL